MKLSRISIFIVAALVLQQQAFCLDPSVSITATPVLKTETSWDGQPLVYPEGQAEITGLLIDIAPGGETGWHLHPVPSFGLVLEGELEVTLKSGEVKRLVPGEALAEVVNTLHIGRNVGTVPVKLVVFYAGAVGKKLTVKEEVP